jgi:hypothetical protein
MSRRREVKTRCLVCDKCHDEIINHLADSVTSGFSKAAARWAINRIKSMTKEHDDEMPTMEPQAIKQEVLL